MNSNPNPQEHQQQPEHQKLTPMATKTVNAWDEAYKIVDFLNRNLREKKIMFGLTKNVEENTITFSIYEVE